jgi:dTDP-4-amino-4,6-dideoxygalactose transaminase
LGYQEGDYPVAERVARELLSLPMFPELTRAQIGKVAQVVREIVSAAVPA